MFQTTFRRPSSEGSRKPRYGLAALKALDQLGLDDSVDMAVIKARYKDLVKRLHPDANAGDRSNEDKLREIIRAYNYLKSVKHV
jgi:DnaJ-class molecular chaperone